jgi:LacI family transcriptional regulator
MRAVRRSVPFPAWPRPAAADHQENATGRVLTLYDVAREAGVSTATVSRVMHGQDRVSAATRRRVLAVIEALGYIPDGAAQSMARHRKEVIGLVAIKSRIPESDAEQEGLLFLEEVLRGVEASLSEIGWSLLLSLPPGDNPAGIWERMQKISAQVDGMLIVEDIVGPAHLALLAARTPVALVAGRPDDPHTDAVNADNTAGTRALAAHLVERHGRRNLFYVAGPDDAPDARERASALAEALASYPGARLTGSCAGQFTAVSGRVAVRGLLARPRRELPDAIICANDQMAIGVMRELQTAGVRVPADVAVAGFDDMHTGALLAAPLTTVRQPMRLLGERACALLLERIGDPGRPRQAERLPTELIVRESCGCRPRAVTAA